MGRGISRNTDAAVMMMDNHTGLPFSVLLCPALPKAHTPNIHHRCTFCFEELHNLGTQGKCIIFSSKMTLLPHPTYLLYHLLQFSLLLMPISQLFHLHIHLFTQDTCRATYTTVLFKTHLCHSDYRKFQVFKTRLFLSSPL